MASRFLSRRLCATPHHDRRIRRRPHRPRAAPDRGPPPQTASGGLVVEDQRPEALASAARGRRSDSGLRPSLEAPPPRSAADQKDGPPLGLCAAGGRKARSRERAGRGRGGTGCIPSGNPRCDRRALLHMAFFWGDVVSWCGRLRRSSAFAVQSRDATDLSICMRHRSRYQAPPPQTGPSATQLR